MLSRSFTSIVSHVKTVFKKYYLFIFDYCKLMAFILKKSCCLTENSRYTKPRPQKVVVQSYVQATRINGVTDAISCWCCRTLTPASPV